MASAAFQRSGIVILLPTRVRLERRRHRAQLTLSRLIRRTGFREEQLARPNDRCAEDLSMCHRQVYDLKHCRGQAIFSALAPLSIRRSPRRARSSPDHATSASEPQVWRPRRVDPDQPCKGRQRSAPHASPKRLEGLPMRTWNSSTPTTDTFAEASRQISTPDAVIGYTLGSVAPRVIGSGAAEARNTRGCSPLRGPASLRCPRRAADAVTETSGRTCSSRG